MFGKLWIFTHKQNHWPSVQGQAAQLQGFKSKRTIFYNMSNTQYVLFLKRTLEIYFKFALCDVTKCQDPSLLIVWPIGMLSQLCSCPFQSDVWERFEGFFSFFFAWSYDQVFLLMALNTGLFTINIIMLFSGKSCFLPQILSAAPKISLTFN